MKKKSRFYWNLCIIAVLVITVLTFTPLVIPTGVYSPMVLGIPYTLWTGIVIAIVLVVITFIGTRVHPDRNEKEGDHD